MLSDQSNSLPRLSAAPLGHTLVSALPTVPANPVFQGMTGPASLHMQLTPIIGLSAPGTLQAYYLSYQPGTFGNTDDLNVTDASRVSIFDWRTGTLHAKIKLPIVGAMIAPVSSTPTHGIFQILGTGRYSPNNGAIWDNRAGTALVTAAGS